MKRIKKMNIPLLILACLFIQFTCTSKTPTDLSKANLVPLPVSVTATGESFVLTKNTDVYVAGESAGQKQIGQYLADKLKLITGFEIKVVTTGNPPSKDAFYLNISEDKELGEEGYNLNISANMVTLSANNPAGLFRGIQTILQLLPVTQQELVEIASGTIRDFPYYSYRGVMLDVARHFFGVEDVKKYIDYLASYKMNFLHLHLSDDQGWRIEIKSWPNLTTRGGSTKVGGGEGGFYTQEQYSELVKYAEEKYITIIPEIDMPGHTNAALASYAELNCSGKTTELYTGTKVGFSTLCTENEITYKFIDDVVGELAALTPGPYIHIGGDESHVTKMKDYIPFINRVQGIVVSHGKKVIGWDEIANASLLPSSIIQFWANTKNASLGTGQGAKVIMSPASKAYLDMKYDSTTTLGLHWAGYIEVNTGYSWDPETFIPGIKKDNILGIEAPLWSETVTNIDEIEYMVFPRMPGYAEIGWSAPANRNWEEYKVRLGNQYNRFKSMGINFNPSPMVPWVK
jgi:hexosaminidase